MNRKCILVTGGSGFIGRQLVTQLDRRHDIHITSRQEKITSVDHATVHSIDLLSHGAPSAIIQKVRPTHLVHLAWTTKHREFWEDSQNVDWLVSSIELLRAFGACGGKRALIIGTCAEYMASAQSPIQEDERLIGPNSLYGSMKVALNRATQSLAAVYGFTVVWPRLFHIYGAFENPDRLIPYLIRSTLAQKPIKCQNPDLLLDFIDVRDLASALCELLDADISGAINLGSGSPIKIHDLAGMIMREVYGDSVEYPDIEMSTGGAAAALTPDLQRMTNELGFKPQISLREGIANTIAWWRENDS